MFAATAADLEDEDFVVHIASIINISLDSMHLSHKAQIISLKADKALTTIPFEYAYFANIFSLDLVAELSEHIKINVHTNELINSQQLLYGSIYSLRPVELETLKTYIETNLANGCIKPFKSSADALILFAGKLNGSFYLYINC